MDVIATALVSSLGYDVETACAAARAGLARRVELPFTILEDDSSPGRAVGHPAPLLGGGFEGDGRLIRLLVGAFRDLVTRCPVDWAALPRLAFYLALPPSHRERQGLGLILDAAARSNFLEELGEPTHVDEFDRATKILTTALQLSAVPFQDGVSQRNLRVAVSGHASIIALYESAHRDLQSGRIDLAIVAGVDSLVTSRTLKWLYLTHRLKGAESPAGLFPGEAAAIVVLRAVTAERREPSRTLGRIDRVASTASLTQFLSGEPPDGRAQSQILRMLTGAGKVSADRAWFVVDQNGEVFRANDWGCSLARLEGGARIDGERTTVWYPVSSFGDVGAASGAVATCVAVSAFERGYAPSAEALLLTNSDGVERAGCVVFAGSN